MPFLKSIRLFSFFFFLLSAGHLFSQVPVGSWRGHFPYSRSLKVADTGERIYCAFSQGLFYFDRKDNSLGTLTKINGLSDIQIRSVEYSPQNKVLVVGYENGNIDLVFNKKVVNISDILRKQLTGRKSINNILSIQEQVYLACGFGIVVINPARSEIADTYIIGPGGTSLEILDIETDGIYLYAATSAGVYFADLSSPNLADFANWNKIIPAPDVTYKFIKWFGSKLYLVAQNLTGDESVFFLNEGLWQSFAVGNGKIRSLKVSSGTLLLVDQQKVRGFNFSGNQVLEISDYGFALPNPMDAVYAEDQVLWIADNFNGLVKVAGGVINSMSPNGPVTGNAFHLSVDSETVYLSGGGYDIARINFFNNGEIFHFEDENWISIIEPGVRDVVRILPNPRQKGLTYAATWGWGIIEYQGHFPDKIYNPLNSSLETILPGNYCRVAGMVLDSNENLWVTNPTVANPISVKKKDGTWKNFPYSGIINHHTLGDIIYTQYGHHWVLLPRGGGLFAFDVNGTIDNTNDDRTRKFGIFDENGSLISNEVYAFAEDKNGAIWIGTNDGIIVYFNPQNVFNNQGFFARRIIVPGQNPGEGAFLLANEVITSIFVDGGNRKWVGTEKAGVFLLSEDGTRQIRHFTTKNSPLVSDNITSIAVHPKTGEVFIATTGGLVSYRADATEGQSSFRNVLVFPNPVRPDYDGIISITGLMDESIVKITDINGNLVYETNSIGGQATWDGRNRRGQRASTGVYLVFLSNKDGSETHVTKLLFIH